MTESLKFAIALIVATIPFIVSIVVALNPKVAPKKLFDYFLYEKKLSSGDFVKTSVGYSMQVAAIFLFLDWTLEYGVSAIVVPIFWMMGYLLIYKAVEKGKLNDFLENDSDVNIQTIHGYVGNNSKVLKSKALVYIMAICTIIGLGGTLIVEMDYVTHFLTDALGFGHNAYSEYIFQIIILLFTVFYVLWGGYKAVVETDKFQVPISYIIYGCLLFIVFIHISNEGYFYESFLLSTLTLGAFGFILWNRKQILNTDKNYPIGRDVFIISLILLFGIVITLFSLENLKLKSPSFELSYFFKENENFLGFGLVGVISLGVANSFWQFIDISSLQRLQSTDFTKDESTHVNVLNGIKIAGLESGIIWIFALILAISLNIWGISDSEEIPLFFMSLSGLSWIILPLFVFSIISFMISTIDGFISAMAFVCFYDIVDGKLINYSDDTDRHFYAQIVTFITVFLIYAIYLALKEGPAEDNIDTILYVIYAIQLSIFLVIFLAFVKKQWLKKIPALISIFSGIVSAFFVNYIDKPDWECLPLDSWYVLPPLVVFGTSIIFYFIFFGLEVAIKSIRGAIWSKS